MLDAITAFFALRRTHQPQYRSLPPHITRAFISTPSGDLELLISKPVHPDPKAPPIFFIHGGCGHARVWLEWMSYLRSSGYGGTLYAYSARNHGASYAVPYLRMVYGTSLDDLADDLVACVRAVGEMEGGEGSEAVMVGHSSGGGLLQYVLANGRVKCRGLCLLDAVPHFGNLCMYVNWARHDPWFLLRSMFHLQHPNSPLSSTKLVHGAFFCQQFPMSSAREFARWMPAYESMRWAMGMGGSFLAWYRGSAKWLDPQDVLRNVLAAEKGNGTDAVCIMAGGEDMMLETAILEQQAAEMRAGVRQVRGDAVDESKQAEADEMDGLTVQSESGVQLVLVIGAGHHLQNDLQRDVGAEALLKFAQQC